MENQFSSLEMQRLNPVLPLFPSCGIGKEQPVRAEGKKAVCRLFPVERIVYHRAAYPRKMAAYLMAETTPEPYGEGVIFVICNIDNFGTVIAAAVFGDLIAGGFPAFAVVRYRADLFSSGTEGAEKTFNDTACRWWGNGKWRRREGYEGGG